MFCHVHGSSSGVLVNWKNWTNEKTYYLCLISFEWNKRSFFYRSAAKLFVALIINELILIRQCSSKVCHFFPLIILFLFSIIIKFLFIQFHGQKMLWHWHKMSQSCASNSIQSKHLITMLISKKPFTIYMVSYVWYSITGYSWKRITINEIIPNFRYSLACLLKAFACESETAATAKFRSRVSYSRILASRIFYHYSTTRSYGTPFAGKAVQLSAGKSERQLCTPSLVPSKSRLLSHTSDLLPSRFSFLSIDRTVSLSFATLKRSFSLGIRLRHLIS